MVTALGGPVAGDARAHGYRLGIRGALDRIALGRALDVADAALLRDWIVPRMPVGGGDLIARGLSAGPAVARMLGVLEAAWIAAGYPDRDATLILADGLLK
jgi:poly(A) polymerase